MLDMLNVFDTNALTFFFLQHVAGYYATPVLCKHCAMVNLWDDSREVAPTMDFPPCSVRRSSQRRN